MRISQCIVLCLGILLLGELQPPSVALAEDLVGLVLDNNQSPMSNVRVELVGFAVSDHTGTNGEFRIPFPESKIGTRATVQVLKTGWRAKDQAALSLTLPRNSAESPITIDMVPVSNAPSQPHQAINTSIRPAMSGECLIVVFKFHAQLSQDVTPNILSTLRSELLPGPAAGLEATMSTWRIEQYDKAISDPGAVALGKKLGALFIVTGKSDKNQTDLTLTLTEPRLLLADEEMSQIGLRLGNTAISLSPSLDQIPTQLIPVTIFLRGLQLYLEGAFESAASHLTKAIARSPQGSSLAARASYLRGICHFLRGDFGPAEEDYDKALTLGLDVPAVHWRRAQLFIRVFKDLDSVQKDLHRGIELSGQSAQAYYVSGLLTFETMMQIHLMYADMPEDFNAADDYLRVAMEKDPTRLAPVLTRVSLYEHYGAVLSRDTMSDVSEFVQMAINRGGDRPELRFVLARLYLGHQKTSEAIGQYNQALKLGAPAAITHFEIGQAYLKMADGKSAKDNLLAFLQAKGAEPNQWWLRAVAKAQLASIDSPGSATKLLEKLGERDASARKGRFLAFVSGWVGKTWNKDFLGHKSTEDFLLYALQEAAIIPKITERNSATDLLQAILGPLVSAESGTPPLWCQTDVGRGEGLIVEKALPSAVKTIYVSFWPGSLTRIIVPVEAERLLVFLGRDERITDRTLDEASLSFYLCRVVQMDRRLAFSGD